MTIAEAVKQFRERSSASGGSSSWHCEPAFEALLAFAKDTRLKELEQLSPSRIREFLGRWLIDVELGTSSPDRLDFSLTTDCLYEFFKTFKSPDIKERLEAVRQMKEEVPKALEIAEALAREMANRPGPFPFSEFLTTFDEGGQTVYHGNSEPKSLDSFFEIVDVKSMLLEARDLGTDVLLTIVAPPGVTRVARAGFVLNLEVVRYSNRWEIVDYGAAYPPGINF